MKALQLGRYHLLDRIAFGGMAEIYRAKTFDEQGRVHMVAVKRILSHLARDEEFIKMLVDEARIASLMRHENIAKTYEFCHAQGEYFIAMEYVDGKDGRTLLDRCRAQRRWIPPELCAFVMMHALRALQQAHTQTDRDGRPLHLIHRDVSPSNVICSYSGEVKLCDFGIAKATLSQVQTRSGVIKGKVKYMSPEQAMGRQLDPRSDIFSAGSVLYEFLTKVPPFLAPNEMELLVLVRETRYTPVRERNPMVPPALEIIVDTAMSRDRRSRYQTAAEFADALQQYLNIHAPKLTRSHLGQFIRQLFADDIEKELRALEEYVVEDHGVEDMGVNLIAEDLGPGADYARFSANPTAHGEPADDTPQDPRRGEIKVDDGGEAIGPRRPEEPTVILESSDLLETGTVEHDAPPEAAPEPSSEILWQRPGASMVDPRLHDANTQILDLAALEGGMAPPEAPARPAPQAPTRPAPQPPPRGQSPTSGSAPEAAPAPRGFRPATTLSGTGPVSARRPPSRGPTDLHDLPTGEIEEPGLTVQTEETEPPPGEGGTDKIDVQDFELPAEEPDAAPAPDAATRPKRDTHPTEPLPPPEDIVSVIDAPASEATGELDLENLQEVAQQSLHDRGTAELDVGDLEEVYALHDRGTDLIEVGEDDDVDDADTERPPRA